MVSKKAKPPTPPELSQPARSTPRIVTTASNERQRPRHSKDNKPSRSSRSHHRSTRRKRASPPQHSPGDQGSTSRGPGHHHDTSSHRHEVLSRTPRTEAKEGRDLTHPIYHRSNGHQLAVQKDSNKYTLTHIRLFMLGPRMATMELTCTTFEKDQLHLSL